MVGGRVFEASILLASLSRLQPQTLTTALGSLGLSSSRSGYAGLRRSARMRLWTATRETSGGQFLVRYHPWRVSNEKPFSQDRPQTRGEGWGKTEA